jgi:hypothetical protein
VRIYIVATTVALILVASSYALSCSCATPRPIPEALVQADVVFVGTVARVERSESLLGLAVVVVRHLWSELTGADDPYLDKWEGSPRNGRVAHFRIAESFKGLATPSALVHTGFGGSDCGYDFEKGVDYVVYGYLQEDALRPGMTYLTTTICTRTASVMSQK